MTARQFRHAVPRVKAALLAPGPLLFGYLAYRCAAAALLYGGEGRGPAAIVAFAAALAVTILAAVVAAEIVVAYLRWQKAQEAEDRMRCPDCDGPIRPGVIEKGRLVCLPCARKGWATASELPAAARRAGM